MTLPVLDLLKWGKLAMPGIRRHKKVSHVILDWGSFVQLLGRTGRNIACTHRNLLSSQPKCDALISQRLEIGNFHLLSCVASQAEMAESSFSSGKWGEKETSVIAGCAFPFPEAQSCLPVPKKTRRVPWMPPPLSGVGLLRNTEFGVRFSQIQGLRKPPASVDGLGQYLDGASQNL